MFTKSLILLALAGVAVSSDLTVGTTKHGVKVFDENKVASPALWLRDEDVTISVNETDVISGIVIKDARPKKDGEARIVHGGVGQKNVTVQLKSPTILRGFDFHIEVYAVPESEYVPEIDADQSNGTTDSPASTATTPTTDEEKKSDATTAAADISTTVIPGEKVNVPVIIGAEDKEQSRQNREITTDKPESTPSTLTPEITDEATSTTAAPVTEEKESSSTAITSAHGAQISGFRPQVVGAYPSHPMVIATDDPTYDDTTEKSVHKREVSKHLEEPMEVNDSEEDLSEEEDSNEEDESVEEVVPKILLYTTDKFVTPLPYTL